MTDTNNEDLLYFTFKSMVKKYKKLLISEHILESQEVKSEININNLNQLLLLKFKNEQKIVAFGEKKFLLRDPTLDELTAYIQVDVLKKLKIIPKEIWIIQKISKKKILLKIIIILVNYPPKRLI